MKQFLKTCGTMALILIISTGIVNAQDEHVSDKLREFLKRDYFALGALLQVVGDYQSERSLSGKNGFSVANFRTSLSGKLDGGFGYFLQTTFTKSPAILDASLYYEPKPALQIRIGRQKAPFSAEFLTGAASIDFVNRSQAVSALVPGRQIGAQVSGKFNDNRVSYAVGIFNGNSASDNSNDNNNFMYAGRTKLAVFLNGSNSNSQKIDLGLSAAFSNDSDLDLIGDVSPVFSGDRTALGADFRLTHDKWLFSGEVISANLDRNGAPTLSPNGYHLTTGYMVAEKSQVLVRWDSFNSEDLYSDGRDSDWIVLGYNLWPTSMTEFQANYIIDVDNNSLKHHQWLLNFQIAF